MRRTLAAEEIVTAAMVIVDAEGTEKLTMRRLASELGVAPMSIYWHLPNKEALIDRLCDRMIADVKVPDVWAGTWDERVFHLARDTWLALNAHPALAATAFERLSSRLSPNALRLLDASASLFLEGGFDIPSAARAALTAYLFIGGHVQFDGAREARAGAASAVVKAEHPWLAALTSTTSFDPLEFFEYGFRCLLDGFQAELAARRQPTP